MFYYVVRCFECLCVIVGLLLLVVVWCGCWLDSVRLCDVALIVRIVLCRPRLTVCVANYLVWFVCGL